MPEQVSAVAPLQQEAPTSNSTPPQQVPAQVLPPYSSDVTQQAMQQTSDVIQAAFIASTLCKDPVDVKEEPEAWVAPEEETDPNGENFRHVPRSIPPLTLLRKHYHTQLEKFFQLYVYELV